MLKLFNGGITSRNNLGLLTPVKDCTSCNYLCETQDLLPTIFSAMADSQRDESFAAIFLFLSFLFPLFVSLLVQDSQD